MHSKKQINSHTSARKPASAVSTSSSRAKTAPKAAKLTGKAKQAEKEKDELRLKRRVALTLKMFQQVYEDYQQGKFQRL